MEFRRDRPLSQLTYDERRAVWQCMTVIYHSNLIEDFEFHTRLGITREELADVLNT